MEERVLIIVILVNDKNLVKEILKELNTSMEIFFVLMTRFQKNIMHNLSMNVSNAGERTLVMGFVMSVHILAMKGMN